MDEKSETQLNGEHEEYHDAPSADTETMNNNIHEGDIQNEQLNSESPNPDDVAQNNVSTEDTATINQSEIPDSTSGNDQKGSQDSDIASSNSDADSQTDVEISHNNPDQDTLSTDKSNGGDEVDGKINPDNDSSFSKNTKLTKETPNGTTVTTVKEHGKVSSTTNFINKCKSIIGFIFFWEIGFFIFVMAHYWIRYYRPRSIFSDGSLLATYLLFGIYLDSYINILIILAIQLQTMFGPKEIRMSYFLGVMYGTYIRLLIATLIMFIKGNNAPILQSKFLSYLHLILIVTFSCISFYHAKIRNYIHDRLLSTLYLFVGISLIYAIYQYFRFPESPNLRGSLLYSFIDGRKFRILNIVVLVLLPILYAIVTAANRFIKRKSISKFDEEGNEALISDSGDETWTYTKNDSGAHLEETTPQQV